MHRQWCRDDFVDGSLEFDSDSHQYRHDGVSLVSVTTFLHRFQEPFDTVHHASRIAERERRDPADVVAEWQAKSEAAATLGTAVHAEVERAVRELSETGRFREPATGGDVLSYCLGAFQWLRNHPEVAYSWAIPEVRICHPDLVLAGTVDLVTAVDGIPSIVDWKTSRQIAATGFRPLFPPLDVLEDCEFSIYSLQLNFYAYMLRERYGYHAERLLLVHLGAGGEYQQLEVPFLDGLVVAACLCL